MASRSTVKTQNIKILNVMFFVLLGVVLIISKYNVGRIYAASIKPTPPAQVKSVTVTGLTPPSDFFAQNLSTTSNVYTTVSTPIHYGQKVPIWVKVFEDGSPQVIHSINISSPQSNQSLTIIQPVSTTDSTGITEGFIESIYSKPTTYRIIITDTAYTDYPIVLQKNLLLSYVPQTSGGLTILEELQNILEGFQPYMSLVDGTIAAVFLFFFERYMYINRKVVILSSKLKTFLRIFLRLGIFYILSVLTLLYNPILPQVIIAGLLTLLFIQYIIFEIRRVR